MEKSTTPANVSNFSEDALECQVLEIIGGITFRALQSLEEPEEKDVWLVEEGDDSVFYSDEDSGHQEADETANPQRKDEAKRDKIDNNINSKVEKDVKHCQKLETATAEPTCHLETTDPDAETEESGNTCDGWIDITPTDIQAQRTTPSRQVEEKASKEAHTANPEPPDSSEEKLREDATAPKQIPAAELHISDDKQFEVTHQPEQCNFNAPIGLNQDLGPGCSTLPAKKSSHEKYFNHLTSSKYGTVS